MTEAVGTRRQQDQQADCPVPRKSRQCHLVSDSRSAANRLRHLLTSIEPGPRRHRARRPVRPHSPVPIRAGAAMSAMPPGPGRPVAESIRLQLGTEALVLITPGPHSYAVVVSSVPRCPSRLTDPRAELDREPAGDGPRLAYTLTQAAGTFGLSKSMIYGQLRSRRLGSVRVGRRRIITR